MPTTATNTRNKPANKQPFRCDFFLSRWFVRPFLIWWASVFVPLLKNIPSNYLCTNTMLCTSGCCWVIWCWRFAALPSNACVPVQLWLPLEHYWFGIRRKCASVYCLLAFWALTLFDIRRITFIAWNEPQSHSVIGKCPHGWTQFGL